MEREELLSYCRHLALFDDLPDVISEVGVLMGVKGFKDGLEGPAFVEDVLRIRMSGPIGLHLSVVDLPGLIAVPSEDQTEDDMETVHRMVDSYASNPRTIILAVVQATNDIANQSIIQKSRRFDRAGQRTVGIITKPDLINEGTEKRIALLSQNEDTTKLKLRFFILKNPSPTEMTKGITAEQRQKSEVHFFQTSPWKELSLRADRIGVVALRTFLQSLLDSHIERELPKVREEIKNLMIKTKKDLQSMGNHRTTISDMRIFISHLSAQFHQLVVAGHHGTYHETDVDFFDCAGRTTNSLRLRAVVHELNTSFSENLRKNGEKRKVAAASDDSRDIGSDPDGNGPLLVTESELKVWVKEVYVNSRGRELPGNYNHILLSELFHIQSSRWLGLAQDHVFDVHHRIVEFVRAALQHVTKDDVLFGNIAETVETRMEDNRYAAVQELHAIWKDELQQPITYNHYYTNNLQNSREDNIQMVIKNAMKEATVEEYNSKMRTTSTTINTAQLLASLQNCVVVNMDAQACAEALAGLQAYYKVARKTFVDNICKQVIERHLVRNLRLVFSPESVASLSDEELRRIAEEAPSTIERRQALRTLCETLEASFRDLRR